MKINKVYFYFLFLFIGTSLLGCKKEPTEEPTPQIQRGDIIRSNKISALTVNGINLGLINSGSTTSLTPIYDVDMIKLEYYTIDENGAPTVASGSLFIPASAGTYPMLSYHHGTLVKRSNAPSSLGPFSSEGMAGALGASIGFVSCLPDYLGLGESKKVHPYLLSSLSASTSIDMLIAGKNYCQEQGITLTNDLFICGYSEGGFVTMATQIMLEASYGAQFNMQA